MFEYSLKLNLGHVQLICKQLLQNKLRLVLPVFMVERLDRSATISKVVGSSPMRVD